MLREMFFMDIQSSKKFECRNDKANMALDE